jgi:hydrogenase nickel incorporation protein HypA/HybF
VHELSVAEELVELASEQLLRAGADLVVSIRLRVGALAGVIPPALRSAFHAASAGSPVDGARLLIEEVPVAIFCEPCGEERTLDGIQSRRCPVCGTPAGDITRGDELEMLTMELA